MGWKVGTEYEVILEPGKRLLLGVQSINEPDERGFRTVMCTVNGQLRPVRVRDESVAVDVRHAERADVWAPVQVAAPFAGILSLGVEVEHLPLTHSNRSKTETTGSSSPDACAGVRPGPPLAH